LGDPEPQSFFRHGSRRDRQHGLDGVYLERSQAVAVDGKEQTDTEEGRPFVAIHKGMVLGYAVTLRCRQFRERGGSIVGMGIPGAREG